MGTQVLGERRRRWIERVTGQEIDRAVASGGYIFGFRTPGAPGEHRHGWVSLYAARRLPADALPAPTGDVWGWDDDPWHWWSCGDATTRR